MLRKVLLLYFTLFIVITAQAETLIVEPDMGRAPLLSDINHAASSIDMVMYGLTDTDSINALINAQRNKKSVHVLLEKSPYKSEDENKFAIQKLQQANINLSWANPVFKLTHQKTLILDDRSAWIMTFNLTHSAFSTERNFALIVDDPTEVQEIKQVFLADAEHKKITVHNPNLVWSPDNSREKLFALLQKARSTIDIYAQDVSDYQTIGLLAKKARQGVTVKILTSAVPSEKNRGKYTYLTRAGVIFHFSNKYYIHAKVIMVDHHYALLGSMNLSKPSIEDNRELSVITEDSEVVKELEKTFEGDWKT